MSTSANLGVDEPPENAELCWRDASPRTEASLQHTSGQRTRSGAHHVFCCWLKASWRCTPSPGTVSVSCHISKWPDQLVGLSKGYSIGFGAGRTLSVVSGQESCHRSVLQGKGSTVDTSSPRARTCQYSSHIHIFTTPAVRVQHEVTVHINTVLARLVFKLLPPTPSPAMLIGNLRSLAIINPFYPLPNIAFRGGRGNAFF